MALLGRSEYMLKDQEAWTPSVRSLNGSHVTVHEKNVNCRLSRKFNVSDTSI